MWILELQLNLSVFCGKNYTHLPISPALFVLKGIFKITFKNIYNIRVDITLTI